MRSFSTARLLWLFAAALAFAVAAPVVAYADDAAAYPDGAAPVQEGAAEGGRADGDDRQDPPALQEAQPPAEAESAPAGSEDAAAGAGGGADGGADAEGGPGSPQAEGQPDGADGQGDSFALPEGARVYSVKVEAQAPGNAVPASGSAPSVKLTVRAHVQKSGWTKYLSVAAGGITLGAPGKGLRLEALQFALALPGGVTGHVQCQAHVQRVGWQSAVSEGAIAGTTGRGLRIEALQVKLAPKGSESAASQGIVGIRYRAHVQKKGWAAYTVDGAVSGTTGQGLRLEAVELFLERGSYSGGITYRSHVQKRGWMPWMGNGKVSGTTGRSLRMEAVEVKLTGQIADAFDIVYRAHVQKLGWQPWTLNGGTVGTTGRSLRIEALQVKLVRKNSNQNVSAGTYFVTVAGSPMTALAESGSSGAQAYTSGWSASSLKERFYIRKEAGGYSLQSVATGLFLTVNGASVVQSAYADSNASQLWNLKWNGGYALESAAGASRRLSASGGKAVSSGSSRWMLSATELIPDGYYEVQSRLGTYLNVAGGKYASGTNVDASKRNSSGSQRFRIYSSSGSYVIENCKSFLVLDVRRKSTANGANVMQGTWNGGDNQRWTASIDRSGYISFRCKHSGKALEVAGNSSKSGANVCQNAAGNGAGQQWKLVSASRYSLTGNANLDKNVARILRSHTTLGSAFDYVASFSYRAGDRFWSNPHVLPDSRTSSYANEMVNYGSGNCYRFASLFSWLARGLGYSTNVISGWVASVSGGQAPHGWVEVYQGGKTYVCDPDLAHEIPGYNWYMCTYGTSPTAYHSW